MHSRVWILFTLYYIWDSSMLLLISVVQFHCSSRKTLQLYLFSCWLPLDSFWFGLLWMMLLRTFLHVPFGENVHVSVVYWLRAKNEWSWSMHTINFRISPTIFQSGHSICTPTNSLWDLQLLHSLVSTGYSQSLRFSYSNVSQCTKSAVMQNSSNTLHFP